MYAVIKTGGKQYRVSPGDLITVEKLDGSAGDRVELPSVLMVGEGAQVTVGQPWLEQARVVGTIVRQMRGPKILIFKYKRRKGYQKRQGHRQDQTILRVTDILTGAVEAPRTVEDQQ
jgi:large subunit ribosomal protein L21